MRDYFHRENILQKKNTVQHSFHYFKVGIFKKAVLLLYVVFLLNDSKMLLGEEAPKDKPKEDPQVQVNEVIANLEKHNSTLKNYQAKIAVEGYLKSNEFKAQGFVWSDSGKGNFKLKFIDLIFKSTISVFLKKQETIFLYYPAKKKRYVTTVEKFQPVYEAGIPLQANLLVPLLQGQFFIPQAYSVKAFSRMKDKYKMTLESTRYKVDYILNKNKLPTTFLITDKLKNRKVLFFYRGYKLYTRSWIPTWIRVKTVGNRNNLTIRVLWLRINHKIGNIWYLG